MMDFSPSDIPARMAVDVSEYPEDVRQAIASFSELWMIEPPTGKRLKAFWIRAAREFNAQCGEFKPRDVMRALFVDWNDLLRKGKGYTITDINSVVKTAGAKAGELRRIGNSRQSPFWD